MFTTLRACLIALLAVCATTSVNAHIEYLEIHSDARSAFPIESFGFEPNGQFKFELTDLMLLVLPDYPQQASDYMYKLAFVLQRSNTEATVRWNEDSSSGSCFHEQFVDPTMGDIVIPLGDRHKNWQSFQYEKSIDIKGDYHLYFSNCEPNTQVNFNLKLIEYNQITQDNQVYPMYLSAGEASLPTWYFILSGMFLAQLLTWSGLLLRKRSEVKLIHLLMFATVLTKFITLVLQSAKYHFVKWNGIHNGWFIAYYIFAALKGTLMFCVIILIGTGWSYLKPFLTERDRQLLLAVIVAQAFLNIAMVVVSEAAPGSSTAVTWRDILYVLDIVCCILIVLPIIWSIKHLRAAAETDNKDIKATRNLERLRRFRTFYLVTVAFVYFTRIIVFLLQSTLPFELTWMANVFSEMASFLFYGATGLLFAPGKKNPYLSLATDDDDDALHRRGSGKGTLVDIGNDDGDDYDRAMRDTELALGKL